MIILDIFSNLDPVWFNLCYKSSSTIIIIIILIISIYWYKSNKIIESIVTIFSFIKAQLNTSSLNHIKISIPLIVITFIFIIYINFIGMVPYFPRITRQLLLALSIGLPLWLLIMIRRIIYSIKRSIAHLLPESTPIWLSPFLVLIELTRICIRPLTLSFRLAANITAGHVIIRLIFIFRISYKTKIFIYITLISSLYLIFEIIICSIQAYIFCLLISLYANEHS